MLGQQLANLLQIGRGDVPPLNDARFIHEPQIGRGRGRSPAQSEIILAPEPNSHRPAEIDSLRPLILAKPATT